MGGWGGARGATLLRRRASGRPWQAVGVIGVERRRKGDGG